MQEKATFKPQKAAKRSFWAPNGCFPLILLSEIPSPPYGVHRGAESKPRGDARRPHRRLGAKPRTRILIILFNFYFFSSFFFPKFGLSGGSGAFWGRGKSRRGFSQRAAPICPVINRRKGRRRRKKK